MEHPTHDRRPPRLLREQVDEATYLRVLRDVSALMDREAVEGILIGGIASAVFGRPRWSEDIDLFVRPQDAPVLLDALRAEGFDTDRTFPDWLYKAFLDGVLVDVFFSSRRRHTRCSRDWSSDVCSSD